MAINPFYFTDENTDLFPYLSRANAKCEWIMGVFLKIVKCWAIGQILMAIFTILLSYMTVGHFDIERISRAAYLR